MAIVRGVVYKVIKVSLFFKIYGNKVWCTKYETGSKRR